MTLPMDDKTAPSETPLTDASERLASASLRNAGFFSAGFCRVLDMQDLETALTESQLKLEGAERWNGIYQGEIAALKAECERLRKELNLTRHKVITCGVVAEHPDQQLTEAGAYATEWNSAQAEAVRRLRKRADEAEIREREALAEIERLRRDADIYLSALKTAMHGEDLGYVWEVCSKAIDAASAEGER